MYFHIQKTIDRGLKFKFSLFLISYIVLIISIFIYFNFKYVIYTTLIIFTIIILILYYFLRKFKIYDIKWSNKDGEIIKDLIYGEKERNKYDLYIPKNIKLNKNNDINNNNIDNNNNKCSLFLFIHGGAWIKGDKKHPSFYYKYMAKNGYISATMNYSFLNKNGDINMNDICSEIDKCICHIRDYIKNKGFNINKVALCGVSAGSHLALLYTYKFIHSIPISFIVDVVGPTDLNLLFKFDEEYIKNNNKIKNEINMLIYECSGKKHILNEYTLDNIKKYISEGSPIEYIKKENIIPTIFIYGQKDFIVKIEHKEKIIEKYKELGGKYQIIIYPNSGHMLIDDPEYPEICKKYLKEYADKYF